MAAAGIISPFAIEDLSIMGLRRIPRRLPMIFRRIRETADAMVAARPDALVIIDSPDFTHRVARRVRRLARRIPILDYVSPSIWAWRPGRARAMRAYVDQVLAILPFEPALYAKLGGPPCRYVGHPLIERIAELRPNAEEAQRRPRRSTRRAGPAGKPCRAKSGSLLDTFGSAIEQVAARCGPMELVLPTVPHLAAQVRTAVAGWKIPPRVVVDPAEKWAAFRRARAALAASGTVTLELALAGIPTVAAYRMSRIEELIVRGWCGSSTAAERHPGQSGPGRERRAGIFAVAIARRERLAEALAAAAVRHAAAAAADRGFRPARRHHGHRQRSAERQGRGHRPRCGAARPARSRAAQAAPQVNRGSRCRLPLRQPSC